MQLQGRFNKFSVNEVLVSDQSDGSYGFPPQIFYLVPVYLRLKIKNFTELNLQSLNTKMKCVIFLTVYYGGLSQQVVGKIITQMNISFQYNKTIDLSQQSQSQQLCLRVNEDQRTINFYIYHEVTMTVVPYVFWSPFQVIESDLTISLNSIVTKIGNNKVTIKFNLMNHQNQYLKFYYAQDVHFGHYDLAEKRLNVQYTNKNQNYYTFFEEYNVEKTHKQKQYQVSVKYIQQINKQNKKIKKKNSPNRQIEIPTNQQLNLFSLQSIQSDYRKNDSPNLKKSKESINDSNNKYMIKINNNVPNEPISLKQISNRKRISQLSEQQSIEFNLDLKKASSQPNSEYQSIMQKGLRITELTRMQNFKYAKFHVVLYKKPIPSIFAIYAPLWLLSFINLCIFFQDNGLGNRIQNVAALVIAFVAFIPVVRDQLPTIPNITFVQIIIIGQAFTSLLCLIDSLVIRNKENFTFVWYEDGFFITSLCITLLGMIIVIGMLIIHEFYLEDAYNATILDTKFQQFKHKQWCNQELAEYMNQMSPNSTLNFKPQQITKANPLNLIFTNMTLQLLEEQIKARLMNSGG